MINKIYDFFKIRYRLIFRGKNQIENGETFEDIFAPQAYLIYQLIKQAEIISPLKTKPSEKLLKIIFSLKIALNGIYKRQNREGKQVFNLDLEKDSFPHLMDYIQNKTENGYILIDERFILDLLLECHFHVHFLIDQQFRAMKDYVEKRYSDS